MTVSELANYLAFHPSTIYRWAQRGIIPGEKVKGVWQFSREAIDAWIEQHRVQPKRKQGEGEGHHHRLGA